MKLLTPLLIAASLSVPLGAALAQQAAAPAAAASMPANTVRPEVGTGLQAVIDLHKAGKLSEALARLDQTIAAAPSPTPFEQGWLQRTRGLLVLQMDRPAEAVTALEASLATNTLPAQDQLLVEEALLRAHFLGKNYPAAIEWARKAAAHGSTWSGLPSLRTKSLYLSNDFVGAAKDIEARLQANPTVPASEEDLRLLASSYGQAKDQAGYQRTLERLMREYPRPDYWPDMLSRVQRAPGWQQRWDIDLYRLRLAVGAMQEGADYTDLAELASKVGLPVEAQQVLEAGFAKGVLGSGSGAAEAQKLRTTITKLADDDRRNLATPPAKAPTIADARSANTALQTGFALVTVGQAERGLELMKTVVAGPHLNDAAYGRLQLALALHRAGRTPEALDLLRALGTHENLGLLARLWVIALTPKKA